MHVSILQLALRSPRGETVFHFARQQHTQLEQDLQKNLKLLLFYFRISSNVNFGNINDLWLQSKHHVVPLRA